MWAAGFHFQPHECAPVEEGALPGVAAVHPHRSDRERWLVEIVAADDVHLVEVIGLPDLVELTSKLGPVARKAPSERQALSVDAP